MRMTLTPRGRCACWDMKIGIEDDAQVFTGLFLSYSRFRSGTGAIRLRVGTALEALLGQRRPNLKRHKTGIFGTSRGRHGYCGSGNDLKFRAVTSSSPLGLDSPADGVCVGLELGEGWVVGDCRLGLDAGWRAHSGTTVDIVIGTVPECRAHGGIKGDLAAEGGDVRTSVVMRQALHFTGEPVLVLTMSGHSSLC